MLRARSVVRRCTIAVGALALTAGFAAPAVQSADAASSPNPVAGMPWGIYKGTGDGLWPAYQSSSGRTHRLLGRMALHARVRSYGSWIPTNQVGGIISKDIAQEQNGNPNVLDWIEIFRLWPHEEAHNHEPLSPSDQQAYKNWINAASSAIGSNRVGIILEPDFPLTLVSWGPKIRAGLVKYAAQTFSANNPNATVYIDGGSEDWLPADQLVKLLESGGIQYARGFDLGASHHDATAAEIRYGRTVAQGLARDGYPDKHFVVDTSDNGRAYTNKQFYAKYPRGTYNANNPPACRTKTEHVCVSLGIPPTTDVSNTRWKLPPRVAAYAPKYCDAYVWIGHPWKINNGHDFDMQHALDAARTDPFF